MLYISTGTVLVELTVKNDYFVCVFCVRVRACMRACVCVRVSPVGTCK